MIKQLFLFTSFISINALAETYIIEMQRPLSRQELRKVNTNEVRVEIFDYSQSDYFRRTYRVETSDLTKLSSLPLKTTEKIYRATHLSLEPKRNSKFVKSDELFHYQWGLFNQGQSINRLIGNTKELTLTGKPNVDIRWAEAIAKVELGLKRDPLVAVVDMGIDFNHPDLKGRIFKNRFECDQNGEIVDSDQDKDKNGFKGDCMGWNFAARNMYEARRPVDDNGHGTHISGIMAALSNEEGITGVSSKIKILPIKVTGNIDESNDRKTIQPLTDRIAKGILYATNMGADVINLSLGWTRSMDTKYLREALDYAIGKGVIIVAAAGNNNNNATIFPCSHFEVICVGAASIDGSLADFSNYGGEVDILAPGEEIVSTIPLQNIPLQLNLQGYDILSGTSQAAPFVSAVASLLRANFPKMHRDDVMRRILDSADAGIPGQSLAGMLNLKGAFEVPIAPSVKPVFKNFSTVLFDGLTNKVSFNLPVKNLGSEAKNVLVKIESLSANLSITQSERLLPLIRPGEVLIQLVDGVVIDPHANNRVRIKVTVSGDGVVERSFQHEFRLARDIYKDPNSISRTFVFQDKPLPVGIIKDGEVRNLINTVEKMVRISGQPEYYLPRVDKESTSIEIRFLRPTGNAIEEVQGMILLPEAIQLLNVMLLDVNLDGVEDYLIRAIACKENCDDPNKAVKYIQYSSWNKDLSPLFGKNSFWSFLPNLVNVDIKSQRFMKIETKDFGPILVPTFVEKGIIPNEQQLIAPFTTPDKSEAQRIYYLGPENKDGKVEFNTKTISTAEFTRLIRENLKLAKNEEVQTLHLMNQTPEELNLGVVKALVSVGKGYLRRNFLVDLSHKPFKPEPYVISQNLWGYDLLPSFDLDQELVKNSYAGLVSRNRLVMNHGILGRSFSYHAQDSVEVPLSTIASFSDDLNEYTFFQTPSYLFVAHNQNGSTGFSKIKINRFSFLPGYLFNDSFYPVTIRNKEGKNLPALYVDETDIQSSFVSFTIYDEGELKSPSSMSAYIPQICKPMDPVKLEESSSYSVSLLCFENKQWVLKYIEIGR